ncbi:heme/hemin ABC transporter substrate-binding protein [Pseudohaliea rubra]|uniref:heme/hemin ABC transporter substrate-binding protein n=1 Tax=Pseudohaliea rubra TaxID=475795 RepID=UPI00137805BB|nr:ABC transporter substrate-binding protein [Pseudohaliea rubra]
MLKPLQRGLAFLGSCLLATGVAALECSQPAPDPSRIAVAGGSLAEILYALGEEARIVAVDRTATYPVAARELPQIGYVRNLSAEGLLSLQPTLVLGEHDMGPPAVVDQLSALGLDLLVVPERFDAEGVAAKIRCVAAAVGRAAAGEALVAETLAGAVTAPAAPDAPRGMVLLGLRGGSPVAAGRDTSGSGLLAMAGVRNALEGFEGWKPVSEEAMALAAPAFIVVPERGVADAGGLDALLAHPALRLTPAAQAGRVITMDGMAMLGFGPRTVATAARLRKQLQAAP